MLAHPGLLDVERPTLSAALIVKNEERALGRALVSIRDAVDEIVVVDTGSTDRTKEIARNFTDRVYDFEWTEDFAAARQFSFDRATGDWVFWLDADDIVVHADRIRAALRAAERGTDCFWWKYVYGQDQYGNPTCELWRERCVRRSGAFRWEGKVHEYLAGSSGPSAVRDPDVLVLHRPDRERRAARPRRNIEILQAEYREAGGNPPPRTLFYLGNEHFDLDELDDALLFYQRFVPLADWQDERCVAQLKIASIYRRQGQHDRALEAGLQALKSRPDWPTVAFGLAETYYYLQDWSKVVHWAEIGQLLPAPDTAGIVYPMEYRYAWLIYYTNALYRTGHLREALEWTERALQICPGDRWHLANRRFFGAELASAGGPGVSLPRPSSTVEPDVAASSALPAAPTAVVDPFPVPTPDPPAQPATTVPSTKAPGGPFNFLYSYYTRVAPNPKVLELCGALAEDVPYTGHRDDDLTVIVNAYARPDYLPLIWEGVQYQTRRPRETWIVQNNPNGASRVPRAFFEQVRACPGTVVIDSGLNHGCWFRFFLAALYCRTRYVVICDDDTLPGRLAFESALADLAAKPGLYGAYGLTLQWQPDGPQYWRHELSGWPAGTVNATPVDFCGQMWIMETSWLKELFKHLPDRLLTVGEPARECGEEQYVSFVAQKLGLGTYVYGHGGDYNPRWSSIQAHEMGSHPSALHMTGGLSQADYYLRQFVRDGWQLLQYPTRPVGVGILSA
jgi:tetratricopeptide (TPR) repeat protein